MGPASLQTIFMATKKKILKQLKAIAADMPKIQERKNVHGTPVVATVDHVDKMKKMYKRYGEGGVHQYLIAVKTFELQNKPKLADVFPDAI